LSTFLYFLPRAITNAVQDKQELIDAGITYVEPEFGGASNHTASGPGGLSGVIWSMKMPDGSPGPEPRHQPDKQTWRKHPSGKYWVGIQNDARPTPETLTRGKMVSGVAVPAKVRGGAAATLLDGNRWVVPLCVPNILGDLPEGETRSRSALPQEFDMDDAGEIIARVRQDFVPLAERCYALFNRYVGYAEDSPNFFKADMQLAADLLAVNYRLSLFEAVTVLKLFGDEEYDLVPRAAIEADAIDAAIAEFTKKSLASADSATSSGAMVDAPASKTPPEAGSTGASGTSN
jgi:hypothetical protein